MIHPIRKDIEQQKQSFNDLIQQLGETDDDMIYNILDQREKIETNQEDHQIIIDKLSQKIAQAKQ